MTSISLSGSLCLEESGRPSAGFIPTRALSRPSRPNGSGQARVPSWSRRLVLQSLGFSVPQRTSALTATHRRDCGRRSRPQTRSTSRTIGPPAAPVCSRPAPCQRTDARSSRALRGSGHGQLPVAFRSLGIPVPGGPSISRLLQPTVSPPCRFYPSQPPKGGAINARAMSSLRITVVPRIRVIT